MKQKNETASRLNCESKSYGPVTKDVLANLVSRHASQLCRWPNEEILTHAEMHSNTPQHEERMVPDVFKTDEALALLTKLRQAGILDEADMPNGLSGAKKGVLAWLIAQRLGINDRWKAFEQFWNVNSENLRTNHYIGMNQQQMSHFIDNINNIIR